MLHFAYLDISSFYKKFNAFDFCKKVNIAKATYNEACT